MNVLDLGCGSCPSRWIPYADLCDHNFDYKEGVPPLDVVAYSSTKEIPTGKYHQVWLRHSLYLLNDPRIILPELCRITTSPAYIIIQDNIEKYADDPWNVGNVNELAWKFQEIPDIRWAFSYQPIFQDFGGSNVFQLTVLKLLAEEPENIQPGSDREMAYWKLRLAIANNETCPCCRASVSQPNTWNGCDCGSSTMDVLAHSDCYNRLHSLTNGCGLWQDLMAVIVQRFEPISDDLAYSHSECEFIGGSFTDRDGGIVGEE